MKVDFKIVCVVLLAFCFVAESEGWWSRRSSSSGSSSSSRSSSRSSSSSSRSSSSSSSSRRSSSRRRGWGSKNSCPLTSKAKRLYPKNIPETFHHCLEATPQQCCTEISRTATVVLHFIDYWPMYRAIGEILPKKVKYAIKIVKGVNLLYKTGKQIGTLIHQISGAIKKYITKIDLVERSLAFALLLKFSPECSSYVIRCLQKSHMWTTLRNQPGKATHSAALLYTEDGAKYLIEKGGTLGTRNDRRQIRRVFFLTPIWTTEKTITPAKRRTVQEYYRKMGGGYNLYDDNCHDGTKAVERLAESSD